MANEIDIENLRLMKNIEILCREVVMAISYSSKLNRLLIGSDDDDSDIGNDIWIYCKNSCASMGIVKWCSVFGSKKEKTHWTRLNLLDLPAIEKEIFSSLNLDQATWEALQNQALTVRDKFIAHNDFLHSAPNIYKRLEPYVTSANILRDEILAHFAKYASKDPESNDYMKAVTEIPSGELDRQLTVIFEAGLKSANKALMSDAASGAALNGRVTHGK